MVMFNYLFIVCEFINFFEILIFTSWNESLYIYINNWWTCCDSHPSFERLLHEDNDVFYI
jgi:hypothetical protein